MEIVGGIASVTQLVAYSHGVAQRLKQLYKAAQEGPRFCRSQRCNIEFLLESIQRLCIAETPDTDCVFPLLIATAKLAISLLNLLEPRSTFYNRWLWVSKGQEIQSAFRALNDKTRLLQLHISERTYNILEHMQKDIQQMSQTSSSVSAPPNQSVCANDFFQSNVFSY